MPFGQAESSAGTAPLLSAAMRSAASLGTARADFFTASIIHARTALGAHRGFPDASACFGSRAQDVAD
jgi:hypothetical protein